MKWNQPIETNIAVLYSTSVQYADKLNTFSVLFRSPKSKLTLMLEAMTSSEDFETSHKCR